MNDFAYEYEQSLEIWDIEDMLDRAIEEYDKKAREVADLIRLRKNKMYRKDGEYVCDRCGKVADITVVDTCDFAVNVTQDLEGVELCGDCYNDLLARQKKVVDDFKRELKFDWRRDKE